MLMQDIEVKVYRSYVKIPVIFFVPAVVLVSVYVLLYLLLNSSFFIEEARVNLDKELPGTFSVTDLVFDWTLTTVHIFEVSIFSQEGREVIRADEIHGAINPLLLLTKTIQIQDVRVVHGGVRMTSFENEDRSFDMMEALGLGGPDVPDDGEEPLIKGVNIRDVKCEKCFYSLDLGYMQVDVPEVNIPDGRIDIGDNVIMHVAKLDVDNLFVNFKPRLFRFEEKRGDWNLHAEDIQVRNWHWANEGFNVETVSLVTDGIEISATGDMRFPERDHPNDQKPILYSAEGEVHVPVWSETPHYFVGDHVHADVTAKIAVEGTMDEIRGGFLLNAPYFEASGLHFQGVTGTGTLEDDIVTLTAGRAESHGGTIVLENTFFSMFTGIFAGRAKLENVDPEGVLRDFGFDYPWLGGKAKTELTAIGWVPFEPNYKPGRDPFARIDEATREVVWVHLDEKLDIARRTTGVLPGNRIRLSKGATAWAALETIGIPNATLLMEGLRVQIEEFNLDWTKNMLVQPFNVPPVRIRLDSPDFGALMGAYGVHGVGGDFAATLSATGRLNYPAVSWAMTLGQPSLTVGMDVHGESMNARGSIKNGRLHLNSFDLRAQRGRFDVSGWIELLRDPLRVIDPITNKPTTEFLGYSRNQSNLDFDIQNVDMQIFHPILPDVVGPRGRAFLKGQVTGALQDPEVDMRARIDQGEFFGQPLRHMELDGSFSSRVVKVREALIDAGIAGKIEGSGGYDLRKDIMDFKLTGTQLELEKVVAIKQAVPYPVEGRGNLKITGSGSPLHPDIGGYVMFERLRIDERVIGDLTMVANTLGDTIHLVGALLPWITVELEFPLDQESPFYARFGLDHIQLKNAIEELKDSPFVDRAQVTGMVEVFLEKDFSRYQVLADLSDLDLKTLGRSFSNKGPVIVGLNDGELVQIQQATVGADGRYITVQGGLFIDQALLDLRLDGDLDLALLNSFRMTFPEYFPDYIVEAAGVVSVDANVSGTPGNMSSEGFLEFASTEVLLRGFSDPFRIQSGTVRFNKDQVYIDPGNPLRGSALQGAYELVGNMKIRDFEPEDLKLSVSAVNMSYRLPEIANLSFGADLDVSIPDLDRPETWTVEGDVDVVDGLYYENVSIVQTQLTNRLIGAFSRSNQIYEASIVEKFPMLEDIIFDLSVKARDGFRIKSEIDRFDMDLELRFDVHLQNTIVNPRLTGDVEVVDGRVAFQGVTFEVRNGTVSFLGSSDNPMMDVVADADVNNRCREPDLGDETRTPLTLTGTVGSNEQRIYRITLNVQGRLDNMDVKFESNPYADQRDILSLILTGCTVDQLTASSASSPTLEVALAPVLGWIEGTVQDVVAVEEFTITPSVDRLKTSIGDKLSRRLSWRLQVDTGLTESSGGQRYELNYKISDEWSAQASEYTRTEDERFVLDFKLRYRYFLD